MATFATGVARGTVIDGFVAAARSQQVAGDLHEGQSSFTDQVVVSRRLAARAGETTAPTAQRIRSLSPAPMLGARLAADLARAYARGIGAMMPQARHASTRTVSAFALEAGVTLRLDLASGPALAGDVVLAFVCRPGGGAEASLRVMPGPLTGFSRPRAPVHVPLRERQAALIPALWPTEMRAADGAEPIFAVVVLVGVEID
jgi:hypothetical protein